MGALHQNAFFGPNFSEAALDLVKFFEKTIGV
jgi:hypothetical protein